MTTQSIIATMLLAAAIGAFQLVDRSTNNQPPPPAPVMAAPPPAPKHDPVNVSLHDLDNAHIHDGSTLVVNGRTLSSQDTIDGKQYMVMDAVSVMLLDPTGDLIVLRVDANQPKVRDVDESVEVFNPTPQIHHPAPPSVKRLPYTNDPNVVIELLPPPEARLGPAPANITH